jgi:predicted nucleotidyltransferase
MVGYKMAHITKRELDNLCETLRAADADIRDIILFGSFAYAPSLARDIDLVVTTTKRKDYGVYLDAVADFPINVDVIARQPGEAIGDRIAWGIKAVGQVLAGDGQTLEEVMEVPAPTFENVRQLFVRADENWESAKQEQNPFLKDDKYRDSFNKLFDIARNAAMAYLNSEQTRWGQLRRALPQPFSERFREIIDTLHINYGYDGNYPIDDVDEEFRRCRNLVEQFVDDLEQAASGSSR